MTAVPKRLTSVMVGEIETDGEGSVEGKGLELRGVVAAGMESLWCVPVGVVPEFPESVGGAGGVGGIGAGTVNTTNEKVVDIGVWPKR